MPNELMKTLTIGANTYDLPQKTSDLTNDSGFIASESDPVFTASAAHGITSANITSWNNKGTYSKPSGGIPKTDLASAVQTSLGKADTALQSYTETDPTVPSWAKASSKPSYTASEVGAAASSHTHGNITNGGDITTNATIASGDRIVINDESASKITNSSITFGSSTTQYLANNGTWQNVPTVPTKTSDLTNDSNFISSTTANNTYVPKTSTELGNTNSITYNSSQGSHSINLTTSGYGKAQLRLIANADGSSRVVMSAGSSTATDIITAGYNYTSSNTYTTISSTTTTINGVVTPTADGMAANKKYVDDSITAAIGAAIGGSY